MKTDTAGHRGSIKQSSLTEGNLLAAFSITRLVLPSTAASRGRECFPYFSDRLSTNPRSQCSGGSGIAQEDVAETAETQFIS